MTANPGSSPVPDIGPDIAPRDAATEQGLEPVSPINRGTRTPATTAAIEPPAGASDPDGGVGSAANPRQAWDDSKPGRPGRADVDLTSAGGRTDMGRYPPGYPTNTARRREAEAAAGARVAGSGPSLRDAQSPVAELGVVDALKRQRQTKRMLRTKAQNEADRLAADINALTAALGALGHPEMEA